jgi:hypothetical protein
MTTTLPTVTQFHESFARQADDESRIVFLETHHAMNYQFYLEAQPDSILRYFYQGTTQANTIAEVFILCFPAPLLCRHSSYLTRRPMTILDCLSVDLEETSDSSCFNRIIDLIRAFRGYGVMNAEWYCADAIRHWYYVDPTYRSDIEIDFSQLEESHSESDFDAEGGYESDCSDYSDVAGYSRVLPICQLHMDYLNY